MTISIVTDSACDLPPEILKELNIHVIPLYVIFGMEIYRDEIDLTTDEFYEKLAADKVMPKTSQPTVDDFKKVYQELSAKSDGIISIHLSSKLSGTYNAALQAKKQLDTVCPIEVVDSEQASAGIGLIVIAIAKAAKQTSNIKELISCAEETKRKVNTYVLIDTLDYLVKGGRIGKAKGLLGKLINIKPILAVKGGEANEFAKARSYAKGIELLRETALAALPINHLAVAVNTNFEDGKRLADSFKQYIPQGGLYLCKLGAIIGVHVGPRALGITFIRD